jgi:hypothetical protein
LADHVFRPCFCLLVNAAVFPNDFQKNEQYRIERDRHPNNDINPTTWIGAIESAKIPSKATSSVGSGCAYSCPNAAPHVRSDGPYTRIFVRGTVQHVEGVVGAAIVHKYHFVMAAGQAIEYGVEATLEFR